MRPLPIADPENRLAVILPHYNYELFILEALDSIAAQDDPAITLFIVDDYSTDNSYNLIQEWCERGQPFPVVVFEHGQNLFIGAALNSGHALAQHCGHRYFTWITSDNIWYPDCFSTLMAEIKKDQYDLVYSGFDYFADEEPAPVIGPDTPLVAPLVRTFRRAPDPPYSPGIFQDGASAGACFVYNSQVLKTVGAYVEGMDHAQDWDYWIRVEAAKLRIGYIQKSLGAVRCHPERRSYVHAGEIGAMRREAQRRLQECGTYRSNDGALMRVGAAAPLCLL